MQPNSAVNNLMSAMQMAEKISPKQNGLPYLAETLKRAGVRANTWWLPSCQSMFLTELGAVMLPGERLTTEISEVNRFSAESIRMAIRQDQAGLIETREFLSRIWNAGVVFYHLDFLARTVSYHGADGETYVDNYPAIDAEAAFAPG